jgi:hypothetical protein
MARGRMALGSPAAPIVDQDLFRFISALEVRKAIRLRYPISLLTIIFPPDAEPRRVADSIARMIRCTDVITYQAAKAALQVLLVDASLDDATSVIRCLRERMPQGDALAWRVRSFPGTATSVEELLTENGDGL